MTPSIPLPRLALLVAVALALGAAACGGPAKNDPSKPPGTNAEPTAPPPPTNMPPPPT
jgi:hypothetical protein